MYMSMHIMYMYMFNYMYYMYLNVSYYYIIILHYSSLKIKTSNIFASHVTYNVKAVHVKYYTRNFLEFFKDTGKMIQSSKRCSLTIGEQDDTIRRDKFLYHTIADVSTSTQSSF